ncbi:MAG TPA: cupin domain-containing protein [Gaiellaceae bacterium]|nr:cupin domain-containing protein [Gaiellaceae bacterium]
MTKTTGTAATVRAGDGRSVRWGPGGIVRVVAGADTTDSAFSIVESIEPPGSAAPLHVHHGEAEGFYVVEGEIELTCGDDTLTAGPGDFVYTPKDVPHKYAVVGDRQARVLLFFSRPGFESFFLDAGSPLDEPAVPPDPERMLSVIARYDMELLEAPGH